MAVFDPTRWYQITMVPLFSRKSLDGPHPDAPDLTAPVSFQFTNNTSPTQSWQVFPVERNVYILRSKASGPTSYLALSHHADSIDSTKGSTAIMRNRDAASDEVFWKIIRVKDGSFKLANVANGTSWNLYAENAESLFMTKNITTEPNHRKFRFTPSDSIANDAFARVQLPNGTFVTAAANNSPTAEDTSSGGLNHAQKAAIGASVGVGVLIVAFFLFGIFLLLRRRLRKQAVMTDPVEHYKAELDSMSPYGGQRMEIWPPTMVENVQNVHREVRSRQQAQELDGATASKPSEPTISPSPVELSAAYHEPGRKH